MKKILALALLAALPVSAQPKSKPLDVTVQRVNDRRTSSGTFSELTITLELPGIPTTDVAASRVIVATAADDSGANLIDPKQSEPRLDANPRANMQREQGAPPPPATVQITLKNPERKAKGIKEVSGEIELYMPGKDPNSLADIAKFTSFSSKPLTHKALKANGVEIALVSPEQLAAEKKRIGEAKRKEAKASGLEGEDLESYVKSSLDSVLSIEPNDVVVRIKDPNNRLQELEYLDAAGEHKHLSQHGEEGLTILSTWGEKPAADWKLRVSMKTPKNLVRYPFKVANVALP
jgi:hypothetical protein